MDRFEAKLKKKKDELNLFVSYYGHNNYKAFSLSREIAMREKIVNMSNEEVKEQILIETDKIAKAKVGPKVDFDLIDRERKLIKILKERLKSDQKNKKKAKKSDLDGSVEDKSDKLNVT